MRFRETWEAEWFDVPATEPLPAVVHAEHRPLLVDLDGDGRLEIVTSPLARPPTVILNSEGLPLRGRTRTGTNWSRIQLDSARIVADDSANWVSLAESCPSQPGSSPTALQLNRRLVARATVLSPLRPRPSHFLKYRDAASGRLLSRYELGLGPT